MHAVFKDDAARVLDGLTGVSLLDTDAWLALRPDATVCEVWEHKDGVRGRPVATYIRDVKSGRWIPK